MAYLTDIHGRSADPNAHAASVPAERTLAVEAAWTECGPLLVRYARGCIRRIEESGVILPYEPDDLVHDAFVILLEGRFSRYSDQELRCRRAELIGTLQVAISNVCRNLRRRELRRWRADGESVIDVDPDLEAHRVLLRDDIQQALKKLPRQRRRAVVAYYIEDRSAAEVAQMCGTAPKTVRNYLQRSKPKLRSALHAYEPGV